jgi:AmmeMemoRadiSam system radical SAM enzyme/AmmeMemoRadiSam system protein B/AmmeMemoRadiSam system protein A
MSRIVVLPPDEPATADGIKPAGWWHEADGGRIVCDLCPRACRLRPGDRGFCFVRQNLDGRMVSTTYGRSTGFCIDPIEKKPLNHFYPGTAVLSFGTAGCNLGCKFCQNWEMSRCRDVDAASQQASPEAIAHAAKSLGCRSVAFTYNDPIVFAEYAIDTAKACRQLGVKTVAVTSGYICAAPRVAFFEHIDAANVDLKAFSEDFYARLCSGQLQPVLDTLRWIVRESQTWLEITTLLIPGENDSPDQLQKMCDWIAAELGPDVPLHFTAFHPDFKLLDRQPTPIETLWAAYDIARRAGLRYVYTGNVADPQHQNTYCAGCGRVVIGRAGYRISEFHIRDGRCQYCGELIAGWFDNSPGDWGGKRQPVRIDSFAAPAGRPEPTASRTQATTSRQDKMEDTDQPEPTQPEPAIAKPQLSEGDQLSLFRAAGRRVAAAVCGQPLQSVSRSIGPLARTPVYGAFVSLKRAGQLRSCCGYIGPDMMLGEAVDHAAIRAAKDDPRFPPITPDEINELDMEVWLLWGVRRVAARGEDRVKEIEIGRHGLQISYGSARGLLLPAVAVEHKLDALNFLRQVCLKAGLPPDQWKNDDTVLLTFEGMAIHGRLADALEEAPETPSAPNTARQQSSSSGPPEADLKDPAADAGGAANPGTDESPCAGGSSGGNPAGSARDKSGASPQAPPPQGRSGSTAPVVRPPAVAGAFYPGTGPEIRRMLDEMFAQPIRAEPWPGVMVPHAGWIYSGALAAATFSRVSIPPQVIVLCPQHRAGGSRWAVAPHDAWLLPDSQVASDPQLASRLAQNIDGLQLDAIPHRLEHAIEVQLPLLARLAPDVRVVGVTVGGGSLSELLRFGQQLAQTIADLNPRPLLVISSDMNHFENDAQTRLLDRLALDAMASLDPAALYRTVRQNDISMCGVLAAVVVMEALRQLGCLNRCERVGYATSGDVSGDRRRVVGYAGVLLG